MSSTSIESYSSGLSLFLNTEAEIKLLDAGCGFAEGPVWDDVNERWLFSDIPRNVIFAIAPGGKKEVYLKNSGIQRKKEKEKEDEEEGFLSHQIGSNGLAFDHKGRLIVCRHGEHAIGRAEDDIVKNLVCDYNGRPFNSPNDLVIKSNGVIYFTDPPYGLREERLHKDIFQPCAGLYEFNGESVRLIYDGYTYPNGVCFSPEEKYLYLSSTKHEEKRIMRFEEVNGELKGSVFFEENSDGIKTDLMGNIYLANEQGVIIISPGAEKLGMIKLGHIPTNLNWGGRDRKTLFITAREAVYMIPSLIR